jgi:8-oxo-dGTP pyrophosphatase MutT (NUDIX family)
MHRQPLLARLGDYRVRFPDEAPMVDRLSTFVDDHPDCFERSLNVGHITGSAWLLDASGERVLLTHHRKLNLWLQPGGHADGDSNVSRVALREAVEESGIQGLVLDDSLFDVDIHEIPARKEEPLHYHYDCRFVVRATSSDRYVVSPESHDLQWVSIERIRDYTDEASIFRMVDKTRLA